MRNEIIQVAESQVGIKEIPPGSNKQKFGEWYGMNGYAWCAMFVSWVYEKAGFPFSTPKAPNGFHQCAAGYNYWRSQRKLTTDPRPGDIVLFDWNKDKWADHTGIFKGWLDEKHQYFYAIEGNTGIGNDSNGGEVMIRKRHVSMVLAFANIINEDHITEKQLYRGCVGDPVRKLQKFLNDNGAKLNIDGDFGGLTQAALINYQKSKGIPQTGRVDSITAAHVGLDKLFEKTPEPEE